MKEIILQSKTSMFIYQNIPFYVLTAVGAAVCLQNEQGTGLESLVVKMKASLSLQRLLTWGLPHLELLKVDLHQEPHMELCHQERLQGQGGPHTQAPVWHLEQHQLELTGQPL